MRDRLAAIIENREAARRAMVAAVRRAYLDGRWQAAAPGERARTRREFRINRAQRIRAEHELEQRDRGQQP